MNQSNIYDSELLELRDELFRIREQAKFNVQTTNDKKEYKVELTSSKLHIEEQQFTILYKEKTKELEISGFGKGKGTEDKGKEYHIYQQILKIPVNVKGDPRIVVIPNKVDIIFQKI